MGAATLTSATGFTNHGDLVLDTPIGYGATLAISAGTLANATDGSVSVTSTSGVPPAISGQVVNDGSFTIASGATLSLGGIYAQGSSGELEIDIAGEAAGSQHGQLVVTGDNSASLAGALDIQFVSAFAPIVGQTFTIITYGSETGTFTLHLPTGFTGSVDYGATAAVLTITGVPPTLSSIAVTPADPTIAAGTDQQFTATGTYSDASSADLTGSVTWASSDTAVATIDATGLAHAVSPGPTTISATLDDVSGETSLTVAATIHLLSIAKAGTGAGSVTSSPAGIDCGSTCSSSFDAGTEVTLTATSAATSTFTGWSQDCSGSTTTCTVTMDQARSVTATFTTPVVNQAPIAQNQSVTTHEDTAKAILLQASDADGDSLTYEIVALPAHGSLSGSGSNRIYTPTANYNGPDSFTFRANDGQLNSNLATVSISVTAVNDVPVITGWTLSGAVEGSSTSYGTLASFTDPDNQPVTAYTATIAWGDETSSIGDIVLSPLNRFEVRSSHTYKRFGTYTITVTAVDLNGGSASASTATTVADARIFAADFSGQALATVKKPLSGRWGCFEDTNPYSVKSDFTALIDWGDGTTSEGQIRPGTAKDQYGNSCPGWDYGVFSSHTYSRKGTFRITITITSVGGSTAIGTGSVRVR